MGGWDRDSRLLIPAPGSAESRSGGGFFSVALFPASAQITSCWQCSVGPVPLQGAGLEAPPKEQFSDVFIGESEEVRMHPCL